jgi:hypothetical protein
MLIMDAMKIVVEAVMFNHYPILSMMGNKSNDLFFSIPILG